MPSLFPLPGYELLHSLVFIRLFSTLITLYVLHHEDSDKEYLKGLNALKDMDETKLVHFIRFPRYVQGLSYGVV